MEEAINWWNTLTEEKQLELIKKYNISIVKSNKIKVNQIQSIYAINKNFN